MTDKVEVTDDLLDDYLQIGNSNPTDSTKEGTNVQLIDLTEILAEEEAGKFKTVVTGLEELSLGVLSKGVAIKLNLKEAREFDPFPSAHNARLGAESFFGSILSGIEKAITWVIKFVRNCIMWVVNLIKKMFGFEPSQRQAKALSEGSVKLRKELEDVAVKLGLPTSYIDPANYFSSLPNDKFELPQLEILASKLRKDGENLEGIIVALTEVPKLVKKIDALRSKLGRAITNYNRVIDQEYAKFLKVKQSPRLAYRSSSESTELSNIRIALNDAMLKVDRDELLSTLRTFTEGMLGKPIESKDISNGLQKVMREFGTTIDHKLLPFNNTHSRVTVEALLRRGNNLAEDALKNTKVDVRVSGKEYNQLLSFATIEEAKKIEEIDRWYSQKGALVDAYTQAVNFTKEFMEIAIISNDCLLRAQAQANAIVTWRARMEAYVLAVIAEDFNTISQLGLNPLDNNLRVMDEAVAQTVGEKLAATNQELVNSNFLNIKTIASNLKRQVGIK